MMNPNLFSIFDPSTSINFQLNWISMYIIMFIFPLNYWLIPSRYMMFWMNILKNIYKEMKIILNKKSKPNLIMMISLMLMIMIINLMGLFPYIFTPSSHLAFSLSFSLTLWLSMMLYGWILNMDHMFIHLIPNGTPMMLMPFMVLIETISNIIRPGTLAIRLSANMIAGHMLLTLMGSTGNSISLILLTMMIIIQNLLMILEISVAIIQSYVFTILSVLYSSETN